MSTFTKLFGNNPIFLAPMAGITHLPFRLLCRELGAAAGITELISIISLYYSYQELQKSKQKLNYLIQTIPEEKPVGLQVFGHSLDHFEHLLGKLKVKDLGFNFLDLNVGCPVPKVCNPGAGSRLLADDKLPVLEAIIATMTKNLPDIPFSIKIRAGYRTPMNLKKFAEMINLYELLMLTLHPRTAQSSYSDPANHDITKELVDYCAHPVVANGDIATLQDAKLIREYTGAAGIMVGRAAKNYPWMFHPEFQKHIPTERFIIDIKKYLEYCQTFGYPNIAFIREILGTMLRGFPNSALYRNELVKKGTMDELQAYINEIGEVLEKEEIEYVQGRKDKHPEGQLLWKRSLSVIS